MEFKIQGKSFSISAFQHFSISAATLIKSNRNKHGSEPFYNTVETKQIIKNTEHHSSKRKRQVRTRAMTSTTPPSRTLDNRKKILHQLITCELDISSIQKVLREHHIGFSTSLNKPDVSELLRQVLEMDMPLSDLIELRLEEMLALQQSKQNKLLLHRDVLVSRLTSRKIFAHDTDTIQELQRKLCHGLQQEKITLEKQLKATKNARTNADLDTETQTQTEKETISENSGHKSSVLLLTTDQRRRMEQNRKRAWDLQAHHHHRVREMEANKTARFAVSPTRTSDITTNKRNSSEVVETDKESPPGSSVPLNSPFKTQTLHHHTTLTRQPISPFHSPVRRMPLANNNASSTVLSVIPGKPPTNSFSYKMTSDKTHPTTDPVSPPSTQKVRVVNPYRKKASEKEKTHLTANLVSPLSTTKAQEVVNPYRKTAVSFHLPDRCIRCGNDSIPGQIVASNICIVWTHEGKLTKEFERRDLSSKSLRWTCCGRVELQPCYVGIHQRQHDHQEEVDQTTLPSSPRHQCDCHQPALFTRTKKPNSPNRGRYFYRCGNCHYFRWVDESLGLPKDIHRIASDGVREWECLYANPYHESSICCDESTTSSRAHHRKRLVAALCLQYMSADVGGTTVTLGELVENIMALSKIHNVADEILQRLAPMTKEQIIRRFGASSMEAGNNHALMARDLNEGECQSIVLDWLRTSPLVRSLGIRILKQSEGGEGYDASDDDKHGNTCETRIFVQGLKNYLAV